MEELNWGTLIVAVAGVLTGIGLWIRVKANIAEKDAEKERCEELWKQDTINALRQESAQLWVDREHALVGQIAQLMEQVKAQQQRIDIFEAEVIKLRADRQRKDEQIARLTDRVHVLEVENARLQAQRDAREEQVDLLKQELALLRGQSSALFTLVAEVSALVRVVAGPEYGPAANHADLVGAVESVVESG